VNLDLEWKEAQLGQLSRLIIGSDPGWRGDLTGEMHLEGTAQAAQVRTRLRATGVHRAEFAPAEPLDFDANCSLIYHYSGRSIEKLECDSPLGDGHIRVSGGLPGQGQPKLAVELQQIPVQAGLDVLRTMRPGPSAELDAGGTVSGKLTYDPGVSATESESNPPPPRSRHSAGTHAVKPPTLPQGPLFGGLVAEGFRLSGDQLSQPIQLKKISFEPAPVQEGEHQVLATEVDLPAGGSTPLSVTARLSLSGYQLTVQGPVSLPRIREWEHVAGIADNGVTDAITGDPATMNLRAEGPWLPVPAVPFSGNPRPASVLSTEPVPVAGDAGSDRLTGTITLHNASWKSDALASPVAVSEATLHIGGDELRWDPVVFSYGALKGTATLQVPAGCEAPEECPPRLEVQFGELNAGALQAALLGAHEPGTLLSSLLARLRFSSAPVWPQLDGTVKAETLVLGPVTLRNAAAMLRIRSTGAEITAFDAGLLGGRVYGSGKLGNASKPAYSFEGNFEKLDGKAVCQLLDLQCTGGKLDGNGKVELSGFTAKDLAASAKGTLHFEWQHGAARGKAAVPAALQRFDRWSANAGIANGAVTLAQNPQDNLVELGRRKSTVEASVTFGDPPKVTFSVPKETASKKR